MKKTTAFITGSFGLIGFETSLFLLKNRFKILGIDNNLRAKLFGTKTNYQKN